MAEQADSLNHGLTDDRAVLQAGAEDVRQLSASLDRKLRAVQEWLANLEGRVATEIAIDHPDNSDLKFGLRLYGPPWRLECQYLPRGMTLKAFEVSRGGESPWEVLLSASLSAKIHAAAAIPVLYRTMREAQAKFITKLRIANKNLDVFAAEKMNMSKEGE